MRYTFARIAAGLLLTASASAGVAQATRTWVSGVGDDVNPCSRTAPCKTFAGAISKTAANGEINVLDSGGFGAITITKSITIDGAGAHASILAPNTTGVLVNGAGINVTLRNLSINGAGATIGNGVRILNAAAVNLDRVVVQNFAGSPPSNGRGLAIETSTADVRVTITNSDFYNNFGIGIHSNPSAGNVILAIDNVRVQRSEFSSIQLRQNTKATINRATLTNSRIGAGVTAELASVFADINNSVLSDNAFGVFSGSGGAPTLAISNNVITSNTTDGVKLNGGFVLTYGNNVIRNNAGNEVPSQPVVPGR